MWDKDVPNILSSINSYMHNNKFHPPPCGYYTINNKKNISANQSECNIEQEESIVYKMELTIEIGAAIIVYHAVC